MVTKRVRALICMLLIALVLAACAPKMSSVVPTPVSSRGDTAGQPAPSLGEGYGGSAAANQSEQRMIVRTAQLSLVVRDAEASVEQIKGILAAMNGYVVEARMWRDQDQMRGSVTVRVPSTSLDDAVAKFKALAIKVQSENYGSQDVTQEYTDLASQLRNLEATEKELLELLTTVREKTGKAEDILAVHRELTSIGGQIEQLKGRMQYLERTSDMASVTIELIPDVLTRPISVGGWQPGGTLGNALRSLLGTLQFLVDAAIWVIFYVLPVVAVLLVPFVIIWLVLRRRRRGKPTAKA